MTPYYTIYPSLSGLSFGEARQRLIDFHSLLDVNFCCWDHWPDPVKRAEELRDYWQKRLGYRLIIIKVDDHD